MAEHEKAFPIWQGKETNRLMHTAIQKDGFQASAKREGFSCCFCGNTAFSVYAKKPFTLSDIHRKLYDYLVCGFTRQNGFGKAKEKTHCIRYSFPALLDAFGIPKKPETRRFYKKRCKDALQTLCSFAVEPHAAGDMLRGKLFDKINFTDKNAVFEVHFSKAHAEYLLFKSHVLYLPLSFLQADGRNASLYLIGRKLAELSRTNKNRCGKISFQSLLAAYSSGKALADRHLRRTVIDPLKDTLNCLKDTGFLSEWSFTDREGIPMSYESETACKTLLESGCLSFALHAENRNKLSLKGRKEENDVSNGRFSRTAQYI